MRSTWMPVLPRRKRWCGACSRRCEINPEMEAIGKDPKTELQEWLQGRKMNLPLYRVVATLGAAHKQTFDVECEIPELNFPERGIGGSRRAGEQAAAAAMLQTLANRDELETTDEYQTQENSFRRTLRSRLQSITLLKTMLAGMRREHAPGGRRPGRRSQVSAAA